MNYKEAGVDIERADKFVSAIKPLASSTGRPGALGGIGGFGASFDPRAAGYVDPIIVTTTDGVGTKLKLAIELGKHGTIGIDLVAMCVNDLICQGAEPLSFLDYFATAALDSKIAEDVIRGIVEGCRQAGCVLAGGETAEMPGMYEPGIYDLAGFAMGAVERDRQLPKGVVPGDRIIGLESSGVHSNGFSLLRQAMEPHPGPSPSMRKSFLTPTRIYVKPVLALHRKGLLKAAAHITGGGLVGNIPRILPGGMRAVIDLPWAVPQVFGWVRDTAKVTPDEMLRTFNCGIGMALVIAPENISQALDVLAACGEENPRQIGAVKSGKRQKIVLPADEWWD